MWNIELTEQWEKDRRFYEKKHPRELAAVLNNLKRYLCQLKSAPHPHAVQAGFLHPEGRGIIALDQKGGGPSLQETRMYTYADADQKTLYLITIGNKSTQKKDIAFSHDFLKENF